MHPPADLPFHLLSKQVFLCRRLASICRLPFFFVARIFVSRLFSPQYPPLLSSAELPRRPLSSSATSAAPAAPLPFAFLAAASSASSFFLACTASSSSALKFMIFLSLRISLSCNDEASSYSVGGALGHDCDRRPTCYISPPGPSIAPTAAAAAAASSAVAVLLLMLWPLLFRCLYVFLP